VDQENTNNLGKLGLAFPIDTTIYPLANLDYNGSNYPRGICAICKRSHFHSTSWILGTFICPICEHNIWQSMKEGVMIVFEGNQNDIFPIAFREWIHSKGGKFE
jgi:hypothetical protein